MHWRLNHTDLQKSILLHPQFVWDDEFDWTPLAQSKPVYTLTGAMDIQQGTKLAGRPITLKGDDVWISRGDLLTLQDWASVPELILQLIHPDGRQFNVIFDNPAILNVKQVLITQPFDNSNQDWYQANLMFLTV